MAYWGGRKGRGGCNYEKGPPKGSIMPTKQLRCIPSIKKGGQGFRVNLRHRSGSYDRCIHVSVVCCSSSLKALLSENSEKEDFPESTIEDIKGWCKRSHFTENKLLSYSIFSKLENSNCPFGNV
jgi:hypothetical protein